MEFLYFLVVATILIFVALYFDRKRKDDTKKLAQDFGLNYEAGSVKKSFGVFFKKGETAHNILTGTIHGHQIKIYDYVYSSGSRFRRCFTVIIIDGVEEKKKNMFGTLASVKVIREKLEALKK